MLLAIAVAAAALLASEFLGETEKPPLPYEDFRAPVQTPPPEPDRPDLFEEPRIGQDR